MTGNDSWFETGLLTCMYMYIYHGMYMTYMYMYMYMYIYMKISVGTYMYMGDTINSQVVTANPIVIMYSNYMYLYIRLPVVLVH